MTRKNPERSSYLLLFILFLALIVSCSCGSTPPSAEPDEPAPDESAEPETPAGKPFALMDTALGTITFELLPEVAPNAVERFVTLAKAGFYYGTTFHRVIPNRLVQGGDPLSKDSDPFNDGHGNTGTFLDAEFSDLPFERGTVGMARQAQSKNTASCQFFITLERMKGWDGEYTIFGKVVEGIEVVDKLSNSPRSKKDARLSERPTAKLMIKRVKIEYR